MKQILILIYLFFATCLQSQTDTITWKVIDMPDSLVLDGYGLPSGPLNSRHWGDLGATSIVAGKISTRLGNIKLQHTVSFECTLCSICDEEGLTTITVTSDSPITVICSPTNNIDTIRYDYYWFSESHYKSKIKMHGTIGMGERSNGEIVPLYNWFEFIDGMPFTHKCDVEVCSERSYIHDLKLVAKLRRGTGTITRFK